MTSHDLNQCWPSSLTHIHGSRGWGWSFLIREKHIHGTYWLSSCYSFSVLPTQTCMLFKQCITCRRNHAKYSGYADRYTGKDCTMPWWRHRSRWIPRTKASDAEFWCEFPAQRPVTRSFDVFFDLSRNKQLSKQPWGWWFETPSWPLWRQCNATKFLSSHDFLRQRNFHEVCDLYYVNNFKSSQRNSATATSFTKR